MITKNLSKAAQNAVLAIDKLNSQNPLDYAQYQKGTNELCEALKHDIACSESVYDKSLPTYYVSPNGDDNADGKTPETAWKTLSKVNDPDATSDGCNVLFERGGVWRGHIKPTHEYMTFSAYGEGKKPCIYGSMRNYADPSLWTKTEYNNVWYTNACGKNIGILAINHSDEYGRYDELVGFRHVKGADGFEGPSQLKENYHYWSEVEQPGFYLYCNYGNPGEVFESIELGERMNVFVSGNHITVDNFCIKFTGAHGVGIGFCTDYTVRNCVFAYLGGSILVGFNGGSITGYGNAVQVYGGCDGYYVNGNWIYQIYDTAITHQFSGTRSDIECHMKDVEYVGNLCEYCHWSIEYYNPDSIVAPETKRTVKTVNVSHNILRCGCYGWGSRGRESNGALFNSFNLTKNTEGFTATSNILDRCMGNLVRLPEGGDRKLEAQNNTFIQKEGRAFGYCYGKMYPFTKQTAESNAKELFHDISPRIIISEA